MSKARDVTRVILRVRELPALPLVVRKLLAVMEDENSSAEDIKKVLSTDHVMAAKVLKIVNSPFYSHSGDVASITQAIVLLGHRALRNLALGFGVTETMAKIPGPISAEDYWVHALTGAAAAEAIAKQRGADAEEAFIAGLLHDIGIFVLNIVLPGKYEKVIADGDGPLRTREQDVLGMRHNNVGQHLLGHWKLPARLCDVARFHHSAQIAITWEESLVSLCHLADGLAYIRGDVLADPPDADDFFAVLETSGVTIDDFATIFNDLEKRVEETRVFLQVAGVDDEEIEIAPTRGDARGWCVLSEDLTLSSWVQMTLGYLGHRLVDPNRVFGSDRVEDEVDVLLLDPANLSAEWIQEINDFVTDTGCRCAVLRGSVANADEPSSWKEFPQLPFLFSQKDLEVALQTPLAV